MAKLIFKYGVMGCGKSEDLIRVYRNYVTRTSKNKVLVLKSLKDTRHSGYIKTRKDLHSEHTVPCVMVGESNLFHLVSKHYKDLDCLLVDEVQFLSVDQVHQLWEVAVKLDIPVITYGLKLDYRGKGFPTTNELLAIAHSIEEIKTVCECDKKATHHLLYLNGEPQFGGDGVFVGDTEYRSVCGECWLKVKESTTKKVIYF
jgi:thymidine kinase